MKIMVFDVAAETVGALSVLNDFYNDFKADVENEYIFIVSKPKLREMENIKVLRYPWIKKSWLHRLYFDNFIAPKLIQVHKVDEVLSLQNVIIPNTKVKQKVYVHNSLPFVEYRFTFTENRLLWVYQNILSKIMFYSMKKANKVIVQTEWMKKACIEKIKIKSEKVEVMPPKINIEVKKYFKHTKESLSTFFYPASGFDFKNHKIFINTCLELKALGIDNYRIILTLDGRENEVISDLFEQVKLHKLPIDFIGNISREKVYDYYSESVLIFPSYIESSPLPLTEAKMHGTPILCSDCAFSHEILDDYEKVRFFNPFKYEELANEIKQIIDSNIHRVN
ncbi:glycosyltransferase [Candidatus Clostridium radicumherbarum]|uniref:Glycosyltransferase n=1 Tax=Candidatus Clostridium radicumherbarum TaxID=3381662 RepID=A0ABW8TU61_9CLOT